jgi:hypothetical protein
MTEGPLESVVVPATATHEYRLPTDKKTCGNLIMAQWVIIFDFNIIETLSSPCSRAYQVLFILYELRPDLAFCNIDRMVILFIQNSNRGAHTTKLHNTWYKFYSNGTSSYLSPVPNLIADQPVWIGKIDSNATSNDIMWNYSPKSCEIPDDSN